MRKGATVSDSIVAVSYCKEVGLKTYGFFMIGFPWEDWSHLQQTKKLIFDLNCDFIEVHIANPYYGTELNRLAAEKKLIQKFNLGHDYFNDSSLGTEKISIQELEKYRKSIILQFHLRPQYILKRLREACQRPILFSNYFKFGIRMLTNSFILPNKKLDQKLG